MLRGSFPEQGPKCTAHKALALPKWADSLCGNVLYTRKPLAPKHLQSPKLFVGPIIRAHGFWIPPSIPMQARMTCKAGQVEDTTRCRPVFGQYHLRLADGP